MTSSLFCFNCISDRVSHFCPGLALDCNPPTYASLIADIAGMHHYAGTGMVSPLIFPRVALVGKWYLILPPRSHSWNKENAAVLMAAWASRGLQPLAGNKLSKTSERVFAGCSNMNTCFHPCVLTQSSMCDWWGWTRESSDRTG
jgi:hypothetical protein